MSLRPDSVYRVDLRGPPPSRQSGSEDDHHSASPPKVLQIRLTEQALQQLASAYTSSHGDTSRIRIDVNSTDPLLVIGDTSFPLHAPLPAAASSQSRSVATSSDAASTATAPQELYQLSKDESTLHRIGTITTKLSVKPTRDVSAVAQRLKQQKEEEEQRKEERRKALMQGASPQLSASSSSSRSGINKTLASVRVASGSPSLASSPLSRSSSLNKLSSRREPSLLHSASLSRGVSREPSPGARGSSPAVTHAKLQGASYDAGPSARRADRAITDSPKTSALAQSRSSSRLREADHASGSRLAPSHTAATTEEDGQLSDDDQPRRNTQLSSPASGTSELANGTKKTPKLTTRQRLAKATKAGSRLLAASERRATPEKRTAPSATHASPPSKPGNSNLHSIAENSKPTHNIAADDPSGAASKSPPKAKARDNATSAPLRKVKADTQDDIVENRSRRTIEIERGRRISPTPTPSARPSKDEPATLPKKPAESSPSQRVVEPKRDASTSTTSSRTTAASAEKDSLGTRARKEVPRPDDREPHKNLIKVELGGGRPRASSRTESTVPVHVVTMRKARPSDANGSTVAKVQPAEASTSSRIPRRSDMEASEHGRAARADTTSRPERLAERDKGTFSNSPTKQAAATRKSDDDPTDTVQRKRRRTNDFVPSDHPSQHREQRRSTSPAPNTPRSDESPARRREPSRDGSIRRVEPASPRDLQSSRGSMPVSASMPSFASSSTRLQPVPEVSDREARRPRAGEYHDRRRDRSYDDAHYDDFPSRDRLERFHRDSDDGRKGRREPEDGGASSRGVPTSSSSVRVSSTCADRPIKGVGPGATHWSEPWLDVRSRSDWHRLAQRFAKAQEEYLISRKRLEAESERLDRELELASMEEQHISRAEPLTGGGEVPAEQSLLFSPHKLSSSNGDQPDVVMRDLEAETAINTSINSRTRTSTKNRKPAEDGDESPEEGEMRSSDDEEGRADAGDNTQSESLQRSPGTTSSIDSAILTSRRSESPDNIAWRITTSAKIPTQAASGRSPAMTGQDAADRPLSYTDLANRVQQIGELHGSLSRMHRVLVEFKAKGHAASTK
ncbi:uncharacterized protein UTRI_00268_B [Ustilago trichophora]|uniref:Uncharacterized protein n=1 Tax=Ustilago trichophora TaxID=86804 RepID=A0A5C3DPF2_9BASI|nr:uncharacterized protein UTRI_00268_B [Ustilago trichophora]